MRDPARALYGRTQVVQTCLSTGGVAVCACSSCSCFGVCRDCRGYPASLQTSGGCLSGGNVGQRVTFAFLHVASSHSSKKKRGYIPMEVQKYGSHLTSVNTVHHTVCYSLALILVALFLILQRSSCHGSFQASSGSFSLETSSSGFPLWGKALRSHR